MQYGWMGSYNVYETNDPKILFRRMAFAHNLTPLFQFSPPIPFRATGHRRISPTPAWASLYGLQRQARAKHLVRLGRGVRPVLLGVEHQPINIGAHHPPMRSAILNRRPHRRRCERGRHTQRVTSGSGLGGECWQFSECGGWVGLVPQQEPLPCACPPSQLRGRSRRVL
jgi:hypothetical protein